MTVSGDGLIHEIVNGLFERVDWRESLARLPIGVIPGGTGNALSRTLIHEQVCPKVDRANGSNSHRVAWLKCMSVSKD